MHPGQRAVLNDTIMHMRAGRIKRRTFLERVLALGISTYSATSLLEGCGRMSTTPGCSPKNRVSTPNVLVWESEHDDQAIFSELAQRFNVAHPNVRVVYRNSSYSDNQQYSSITRMLSVCSDAVDIPSIDVIWLAQYAKNGWILPLPPAQKKVVTDKYGASSQIVASCTYNGQMYSAPLRVDQGVLYYRSDISSHPPKSYQDLVKISRDAVAHKRGRVVEGYVWQANLYEGLVCNFVEVLAGYGGALLSKDNRKVTVDRPEAVDALTEMMSWIGTISPTNLIGVMDNTGKIVIDGYEESDARVRWQNGFAAFMRNWYNAFSVVTDPTQSVVHDQARFSSLPAQTAPPGQGVTGYSCLGGWQLAVNWASQNKELAWQFISEILSYPDTTSLIPSDQPDSTRSDVKIADIEKNVVIRPTLPNYASKGGISEYIQVALYRALTQASLGNTNRDTAAAILKDLASLLKPLLP
jgi:multiple sugar transport system substrate-binding protein